MVSFRLQHMHILNCPPSHHPVANIHLLGEEVAVGEMGHKVFVPGPLDGDFDIRTLILDSMDRTADSVGFCTDGGLARRRFGDGNAVAANRTIYGGVRRTME